MNFKEQINELKETIENLQKKVKDLEKSCEKSYELPEVDKYYYIKYNPANGNFTSGEIPYIPEPQEYADNCRKSGNYFSSDIDANCLASMFNTLLITSKYKKIIEPDTNLNDGIWTIMHHLEEGWIPMKEIDLLKNPNAIYFQTKEHCQEACDILNREDFRC